MQVTGVMILLLIKCTYLGMLFLMRVSSQPRTKLLHICLPRFMHQVMFLSPFPFLLTILSQIFLLQFLLQHFQTLHLQHLLLILHQQMNHLYTAHLHLLLLCLPYHYHHNSHIHLQVCQPLQVLMHHLLNPLFLIQCSLVLKQVLFSPKPFLTINYSTLPNTPSKASTLLSKSLNHHAIARLLQTHDGEQPCS